MAISIVSGLTDLVNGTLTDPRPLLMAAGFSFESDTPNASPNIITFDCNQSGTTINLATGTVPTASADNHTTYQLSLVSGSLPGGLTAGSFYFVGTVTSTSIQLRPATASGTNSTGTVITVTAATGQASLKACGAVWNSASAFIFTAAAPYGRNSYIVGRNFTNPVDLSTGLLSAQYQFPEQGASVYGYAVFIDVNGHWVRFRMADSSHLMLTPIQSCLFNLSGDYTTLPGYNSRSSASFDPTQITKLLAMNSTPISGQRSSLGVGAIAQRVSIVVPAGSGTVADAMAALIAANPGTVDYGNSVYKLCVPIQFGDDGANALTLTGENATFFFPQIADGVNRFNFHIRPDDFQFKVKLGAADSFTLTNTQIKGIDSWIFDTSSAATPGAYNQAGCTIIGANVTLGSFEHQGLTFVNCPSFTQNGAAITDCTFSGTTVSSNAPDSVTGCAFTSAGTGHAIAFTVAGTYDFAGNTFTGYGADGTTDAAVYNNSGGDLTLNLVGGAVAPTVRNGAGASTTFTRNVSVTAPNLIAGTRVRLYNATQAVELDNSVVVGGSGYSATVDLNGANAADGDTLTLYATYVSGVTAKIPLQSSGVVTVSGLSFIATQENCLVYNGWGLNGSSYATKFSADYVDDEVDIIIASNFALNELGAWWAYNLTTADGIRNFFGGLLFDDSANLHIVNSIVSINLDNTTTTNIHQTDNRRLYRDDDVRPVRDPTSGGGGIDVEWRSPVSLANTDAITASLAAMPAAVWGRAMLAGWTYDRAMRAIAAVQLGKASGGPAGSVFRDVNDTTDMVTSTADRSGNRSSVVVGA